MSSKRGKPSKDVRARTTLYNATIYVCNNPL